MIDDVQWFVGIDWATQSHRVCLLDVEGRHVSERDFAHGGAGLTELRDWLLEKTKAAPGQIAVAIETPHGPVVEMLLDHGFVCLRHQSQAARPFPRSLHGRWRQG